MDLEAALTSRDQINGQLRGALDEATGTWGIRVNRVELKSIDPPASIQEAMEKQMRAERDKRATILTAEGEKQSQILTAEGNQKAAVLNAEGEKQSAILRAEGQREAAILEAQGQAQAVQNVFDAVHKSNPNQQVLLYQYLQMLPELAKGDSNKVFVLPQEISGALSGLLGNNKPE